MVYHVKFLVLLRRYSMLQYYHWKGAIDGWACLAKYWGPGTLSPTGFMPLVQYTECRNGTQTRQTGFTILCYYLSVTVRCFRDSLSVTDSGVDPFEAHFSDFCVTKFRQNFYQRHSKEKGMLKILAL